MDGRRTFQRPPRSETAEFEPLVRVHHRRVLAYALALVRRSDVAEDLAQEAFLVAHREFGRFDPSRDFGAWVRGIVRMKAREWARARRMGPLDEEAVEREHRRWDRSGADPLEALRGCLEALPEPLRETVALFYGKGRSCGEAAEALGTTEAVVRKRLQRARGRLSACVRARLREAGDV